MSERRLSNARIQEWLVADLDRISEQMDCAKVQVNSAAIWWFCLKLEPEERARILGEFVTVSALRGQQASQHNGKPAKPPSRNLRPD